MFLGHDFMFRCIGFGLGVDYLGHLLILLRFWITGLVLSARHKVYKFNNFVFMFLLINLSLLIFLVVTFSCLDFLWFYVRFEASLIPTLILILGWGYQPERVQAGTYFIFYTMFASLPLLVSIMSIYYVLGRTSIYLNTELLVGRMLGYMWYLVTVFAFIVKLPIFLVHLWLPKAHVEAPVAGSMILAGVLLKLGGYGLVRVLPVFCYMNKSLSWVWVRGKYCWRHSCQSNMFAPSWYKSFDCLLVCGPYGVSVVRAGCVRMMGFKWGSNCNSGPWIMLLWAVLLG